MKKSGVSTKCVHSGDLIDDKFKGATSPIFPSTAYDFVDVEEDRYPRYFNTPNQKALSKKIADLENCESALLFSSGIAAIYTSLFSFIKSGDHVIFQSSIYGGTLNLVIKEFKKFNIEYSLVDSFVVNDYEKEIKNNTKIIFVESPSNPLLKIIDLKAIANLSKKYNLISIIDNTFSSPINQNPADFGIDIVLHSATKYLGGHSDILAGTLASSKSNIDKIIESSINYGGNLSEYTVWLLERSIKTLSLRVNKQNENAIKIAEYLTTVDKVKSVYYPGLKSHSNHELSKKQMKGFGGMLSFELLDLDTAILFTRKLNLVKSAMSLGGVESTLCSPSLTSHSKISKAERENLGIFDGLLRFSIGIEDSEDIIDDLNEAFKKL
ncbi:PLP-dependent aspartate aminotransferase family protein [Flavobacteriaceae bacterium]|nr:PLP-dependent aspartate aminotransferase family protein [Flavobacteriaceae bacterium]MDB4050013.1 PLP-dependent aspartate aminotransferase family protein [Flavobacteriaceae bacterium]MDB4086264.1 PLP-dependent aspartate aminotransferase family protein [Flavobacteriaceae bacterium]MDB4240186.1 PLP-dependent aspartate aminotransferase family protein [Flavobacteriaceae bacterium]MDB9902278.1 PLP-dependent aspartate aminotransferase family protein [Flavobacteriaceae bacterium]